MTENARCCHCGAPLPRGGKGSVCPRCLLRAALQTREQEVRQEVMQLSSFTDRAAYIEGACSDDPALADRMMAWLQSEPGKSTIPNTRDQPVPSDDSPVGTGKSASAGRPSRVFREADPVSLREPLPVADEASAPNRPGVIGRYKLLQKIGEGGFGSVFLAEQTEPVERRVALKVIKPGMDTRQVIIRFEAERQTLALMDHPNIAKVLDAGATENGRPYFVMELVRGVPITRYCDQNHLSVGQRLKLFVQVCQAIQHAHQKGVIHRDIKPSNILVADRDGILVPKVIDFGIAKATQQALTEQTVLTQLHQFMGTPAYISPEQAAMTSLDIDTRTDIYSLGVLLYELLVGKTPFDSKELVRSGLDEMRRIIREQEPTRPSTKLKETQPAAASRSIKSEIRNPKSEIDKDLDWVVMKCLEKDRTRRYETVNSLALDIERFLAHQPVEARPTSQLYRLKKLVRRHRVTFSAAALVAVALVIALIVANHLRLREREAHRRARESEQAQIQLRKEAEAELNRQKGEFAAKHGRWKEAIPFYQKAIELMPDHQEYYHHLSPLIVEVGDLEGYRQHCQNEFLRFLQTDEARVAERMTKDCLLSPASGVNLEVLGHLAERAVNLGRNHAYFRVDLPWFIMAQGLAEYRQGRYARSLTTLELALAEVSKLPPSDPGKPYVEAHTHLVHAMTCHHLGRHAEARNSLEKATEINQNRLPRLTVHGLDDYWPDWLYAHTLWREASALLKQALQTEAGRQTAP
ncbi:MAG: protein kinase [Verrucomicrobiales bacterium]|nr:protein kinase [Verrucomicrobiales bacterium]